jgi:peroxiredoxin
LLDDRLRQTTQVLALSPDDVAGARKMVERQAKDQGGPPNFPLLADPDHRVIDRYGQLNPELFKNESNPAGYIVPHPAVFVINKDGLVTWKFTDLDARVRASNEQILEALKPLEGK